MKKGIQKQLKLPKFLGLSGFQLHRANLKIKKKMKAFTVLELYTFLFAICNLLLSLCVVLTEIQLLRKKKNNPPL